MYRRATTGNARAYMTGGDEESHEEQDPTAAGGLDRRVHERGTPEEGEQGSWQAKALLIEEKRGTPSPRQSDCGTLLSHNPKAPPRM